MAVAAPVVISVETVPVVTPVMVAVSAPWRSATPSVELVSESWSTAVMTLPEAVGAVSSVTESASALATGPSSLRMKAPPAPTSRLWVAWSPSASVTVARSTRAPAAVVRVEVSSAWEPLAW